MDIPALHTLTNGIIIGICLSISFGLVCFKQMAHAINPKYRRACHFFIAASLIIAAGHLAELLVDGFGVYRSLDLFSILVLVLASSQALIIMWHVHVYVDIAVRQQIRHFCQCDEACGAFARFHSAVCGELLH